MLLLIVLKIPLKHVTKDFFFNCKINKINTKNKLNDNFKLYM